MSVSAHAALHASQQMIDAAGPLEKMSRDLRPVLRRLRQGLTIIVEAREVTDEWIQMIDRTGLRCDDEANPVN